MLKVREKDRWKNGWDNKIWRRRRILWGRVLTFELPWNSRQEPQKAIVSNIVGKLWNSKIYRSNFRNLEGKLGKLLCTYFRLSLICSQVFGLYNSPLQLSAHSNLNSVIFSSRSIFLLSLSVYFALHCISCCKHSSFPLPDFVSSPNPRGSRAKTSKKRSDFEKTGQIRPLNFACKTQAAEFVPESANMVREHCEFLDQKVQNSTFWTFEFFLSQK